jgi:glycosyltransferase involved in cell wall biosynthesis
VDGPVVIVVARLLLEKGHRYFLEALGRVRTRFPQVSGLLVGAGPEELELRSRAAQLGLGERVRFLGERRDVPELLAASDVFVLPSSIREGLSISLLEAMAAERPVVVTDIGGNREVVQNEQTGLVVPPADGEALAQALVRLLTDRRLARILAGAARSRLDAEFGVRRMVEETEALYEKLSRERTA